MGQLKKTYRVSLGARQKLFPHSLRILDLPGLSKEPHHPKVTQEVLITKAVLGERDIRSLNLRKEPMQSKVTLPGRSN